MSEEGTSKNCTFIFHRLTKKNRSNRKRQATDSDEG